MRKFGLSFLTFHFCYWSVKGICWISSAIGKPLAFSNSTWTYSSLNDPRDHSHAYVLVEIGSQCSKPSVIMLYMPGQSEKFMAKVLVTYLSHGDSCLTCLASSHDTYQCPELIELLPQEKYQNVGTQLGNIFEPSEEYISESTNEEGKQMINDDASTEIMQINNVCGKRAIDGELQRVYKKSVVVDEAEKGRDNIFNISDSKRVHSLQDIDNSKLRNFEAESTLQTQNNKRT